MNFFLDSALLGLEYALLAVGVYITFRILNLPDLTVDGSFTFGMAVSTVLCAAAHPFVGLLAGALAGAAAGVVTGFLQTHCKIHPILAGILTMSGLYTVNITVLGGPNVSLLDAPKFFEVLGGKAPAVGLVTAVLVVLVTLFFQTVGGLCIRAAGSNEDMVRASSINTTAVRWAALALANALVALSGAILAQCQGFGDVGAGSGMIVIGLASVIIGEVICGRRGIVIGIVSAVLGSIVYRIIIALALRYNLMSANSLKLLSALIVAATLAVPAAAAAVPCRPREKGEPRMLTLKQLDKTFGAGTASAHHALCGIDLTLQDGEFVTVIGSNGAGKSTLFGAVSGSFFVDRGRIALDGEDITYLPEHKRAKRIARIFQDPMRGTAPDLTLEENVALAYARAGGHLFAPALPRKKRAFFREQLARLDMGLEDRMKTRIGLLSGGQRQAVTLLMATINTPRVLLLDEHTAALDPVVAERVLHITQDIVAENHITTMMVTHNIGAALSLGTRTIMLERGRIVLDLSGETRDRLDVPGLLALYREACGAELDNDRMLLSH